MTSLAARVDRPGGTEGSGAAAKVVAIGDRKVVVAEVREKAASGAIIARRTGATVSDDNQAVTATGIVSVLGTRL